MASKLKTHRLSFPVVARSAAIFVSWVIWLGVASAYAGSVVVDLSVLDHPARGPAPEAMPDGQIIVLNPPQKRPLRAPAKPPRRFGAASKPFRKAVTKPSAVAAPREKRIATRSTPSGGQRNSAVEKSANKFGPGRKYRLRFDAGGSDLDTKARRALDDLVGKLTDPDLRLKLMSYAGGITESESRARWISLSRALSIRSYLMTKGIDSGRIDVRALGRKSANGPPERVDVIVTSH